MKKYYKYIIAVIIIIGIIICFKSCIGKTESDVIVAYIGENFVNRESFDENIFALTCGYEDITGDDEFNVELMEISFSDELGYADQSNSSQKLANAIGMGTARLYFIDKSHVLSNKDKNVFADLSYLGEGIVNQEGKTVAISVKGNRKLDELGINSDEDLYIAIRIVSEVDEAMDKDIHKKDSAARKIAETILS